MYGKIKNKYWNGHKRGRLNKKIMITGAGGALGTDCYKILSDKYEVIAFAKNELDITCIGLIKEAVIKHKPDVIINCAAYTDVDRCEEDTENAYDVNAYGPLYLATICDKHNIHLIHISTDYVFDGKLKTGDKYAENQKPAPINVYGYTKLLGELYIKMYGSNYTILRTSWLFGAKSKNFMNTIIKMASTHNDIRVIDNQYGSPTWTKTLIYQIDKIICNDIRGLYHAAGGGYTTRYDMIKHIFNSLELNNNIIPCKDTDFETIARRPMNTALSCDILTNQNMNCMRPWEEDIESFITEIKAKSHGGV